MDQQTLTKITLVVAVIAIICSAASVYVATSHEHPSHEGEMVEKYTAYFGLNVTDEEQAKIAQDKIGEIVATECDTGYTSFLATGGSMIDGTLLKDEFTVVIVIAFAEEKDVRTAINAVCEEFGLEVVLFEKQYAVEELVTKS